MSARALALDVLRRIRLHGQYANLVLPARLEAAGLDGRDAALATTLVYGSLRWQGFLDAVIDAAHTHSGSHATTAGHVATADMDTADGHGRRGRQKRQNRERSGRSDGIAPPVRDILRLGVYQLLFLDVPDYAAVSTSCDLARSGSSTRGAVGLVDALLRAVARRPRKEWEALITSRIGKDKPDERLAVRTSHPVWIVRALGASRAAAGYPDGQPPAVASPALSSQTHDRSWAHDRSRVQGSFHAQKSPQAEEAGREGRAAGRQCDSDTLLRLLEADNAEPSVTLCARPGLVSRTDLLSQVNTLGTGVTAEKGRFSPFAVRVGGVDPSHIAAVAAGAAGVEDEGSQLAALALAAAPLDETADDGRGTHAGSTADPAAGRWLDLCAGPGGKAALLGALAAGRGATLTANEPQEHRARLVEQNLRALPAGTVEAVTRFDGRVYGSADQPTTVAAFDRVLVDAPCSGLGALRRRPEARWTKRPQDIADLSRLQAGLLEAGLNATRHGGVLAYVTCSPVLEETRQIVDGVLSARSDVRRLDTASVLRQALGDTPIALPAHGDVQLFSDLHDTDMMFISLLRRI